jgi:hypothetical protein
MLLLLELFSMFFIVGTDKKYKIPINIIGGLVDIKMMGLYI